MLPPCGGTMNVYTDTPGNIRFPSSTMDSILETRYIHTDRVAKACRRKAALTPGGVASIGRI